MSQKFWNILVCTSLWYVVTVVCSIMVVGVLTRCVLVHCVCDLKTAQMNVYCSLICELTQKFCNISVCTSLWCVYHVTEEVQAMVGSCVSWCADMLCIASLCVI